MRNADPAPNPTIVNWALIWKSNISSKVRNFLWRSISSCLPTRNALRSRLIKVPEWCPMCHGEPEEDFHVLISCPSARSVWCLTTIGNHTLWLVLLHDGGTIRSQITRFLLLRQHQWLCRVFGITETT